ncbi:iron-sulfur assembly protein IscA-like 2, mitochondrial-like protein [Powellomyces hirtus]|nr:iron-sulfur assembly protein IscA-like 2, mitochondrial-like protein [Powellomyces hirtus]
MNASTISSRRLLSSVCRRSVTSIVRGCGPALALRRIPHALHRRLPLVHSLRTITTEPHLKSAATAAELSPSATPEPVLLVSPSAAKAINKKSGSNSMLRVTVESGGCHGFQYKMDLTTEMDDVDDTVFELDGARVVVDAISLDFVAGSTLDYVEELIGSSFQVTNNPKAESSCGCKTSFNVKF